MTRTQKLSIWLIIIALVVIFNIPMVGDFIIKQLINLAEGIVLIAFALQTIYELIQINILKAFGTAFVGLLIAKGVSILFSYL